jgi:hypothetical protein
MPRPPRIYLPGVSVHVMQRGNNKKAIFLDDHDCEVFLDLLQNAAVDCFRCIVIDSRGAVPEISRNL